MPTAIISDIHGNLEALQTVLADIKGRGVTRIVCLGDIIGYGADPLACVDLVKQHCEWSLMGNHDFGVLYEPTNFNPSAEAAAFWTREAFDAEPDEGKRRQRYEFLGRLRVRIVDSFGNGRVPVLNVHGSPRRPINEYIFPDDVQNAPDKLSTIFERVQRVCFVGHTHVPGVFTDEPDFYPPGEFTDSTYNFSENEKAIINVGSVGQPRDLDPRASYVIAYAPGEQPSGGGGGGGGPSMGALGGVQFVRLPYDVEETARKIKAAKLNEWLADRLFEGR